MLKMEQEISEIIEILVSLLEDVPLKARQEIEIAINMLKKPLSQEGLIKVQEQLEIITNINNIDSYTRNEIYNAISIIESLL